jgi:hypothetical protein
MNKPNVKRILSSAVANLRVSVLGVSFSLADLGSSETVDERIARLGKIKADLEAAIGAVEELQGDANASKLQVDQLRQDVAALQQDKATAERLLNLPEESFARLLDRATRRGQVKGIIVGVIIGLATGCVSSYAVWYFTNDKEAKPAQSAPIKPPQTDTETK